ncbi:MAG: CotH kinase family protein, partial [Planctomycetota bacterium]
MKSFRLLGYAFILFSSPCFAADVVINEVLATNVFGLRDEDGASSDWVELLNRGDVALNLEGFGLTENPRDPHKFAFPRTILPSGERLLVWCSGKNRVRPRTLDVLDITSTIELQPRYVGPEGWRYLTGAPGAGGPPETWSAPNFDDSKWSAGALPLGFAQVGDEGDFETELPRDTGAVFLRRRFAIEDPSFIDTLILSANYDDGLVVYLNGSLILSLNVPKEATLEFGTRSVVNHTALRRERFDLDEYLDLLVPGENVLAVGLFNRSPGDDSLSNDMYLDLELGCVPQILHSSFGLSGRGESLLLTDPNGLVIDGIRFEAQAADRSYARYPDGTGDWAYHLRPTPLAVNDEARSGRVIPAVPAFEPEGGLYDGELTVRATLEQDAVDLQLRFTVDGTVPTSESDLWNGSYDVAASTTIRCAAFAGEERVSHIATQSYILGADYQLPVLSLVMPPDDFRFVQLSNANSGRLFEREAHAEWIEGGVRQFGLGAGLRLHGNAGRDGGFATKKSYRLYFRDEYGSARLRHPIIPGSVDSFDRLVLRSNIHDAFRVTSRATLVRDQLTRDLHIDMGGVGARGTWCNLLVNSQFRGVYNPTERIDLEFFRSHFPDEVPNWDVIKNTGPTEGSFDTWFNLVQYAVRTDLSIDSNYELAAAQVDLENFVRYMALNIWAQNH